MQVDEAEFVRCMCKQCMDYHRAAVKRLCEGPATKKPARKAMKAKKMVSARMLKRHVYAGKATKTKAGLAKDKLKKNKQGKIVSTAKSAAARRNCWLRATVSARRFLNITGFQAVKKGTPLYHKTCEYFEFFKRVQREAEQKKEERKKKIVSK